MSTTEMRDDELIVRYTEAPFTGTGVASQLTWDTPILKAFLRQLFRCKVDERIVALKITGAGIMAYFERGIEP